MWDVEVVGIGEDVRLTLEGGEDVGGGKGEVGYVVVRKSRVDGGVGTEGDRKRLDGDG